MTEPLQIEPDYILESHLGDWETLYNEYTFAQGQSKWDLQRTSPGIYKQIVSAINKRSLANGQSRKLAWSLLCGVCRRNIQSSGIEDVYVGLVDDVFNLNKSSIDDLKVQKQISLDVVRTFSKQRVAQFIAPIGSKQNLLYNVLAAYAKHEPDVGYCQGMNFLAALILIGVDFDEVSAFIVLDKLLSKEYG